MIKLLPSIFFLFISFSFYAQKGNDSLENAINNLRILAESNPKEASAGLLKTKKRAQNMHYSKGVMSSSYALTLFYYNNGDYGKAIEESRDTEKVAKILSNNQYLSDVYRMRGISYSEMGIDKEVLPELNKSLIFAEKIEDTNIKFYKKALIYESIAGIYNKKNDPNKEIYYRNKSIDETKKMVEKKPSHIDAKYNNLSLQYSSLALIYEKQKKKDSAIMYFEKAFRINEDSRYNIYINGKATLTSDMATFYTANKDYTKAIKLAKKAEQYEKQTSLPYVRKDIYNSLFNSYSELSKGDSSRYYLKLYSALNDSLTKAEKKNILIPVNQIISDKETEKNKTIKNVIILAGSLALAMLLLGWFFWRNKNKKLHKNYEKLIEKIRLENQTETVADKKPEPKSTEVSPKSRESQISDDTTNLLLKKLEKFEKSNKFTKQEVSFSYLSNYLETNSKYLNEILKTYKEKTFNQYINDLRIDYITELLYKEPKYRNYKITYLAEISGFSSREVFTIAFKKRTGIPPSYFIENLKNENTESES